jgi:hypothetical protein
MCVYFYLFCKGTELVWYFKRKSNHFNHFFNWLTVV